MQEEAPREPDAREHARRRYVPPALTEYGTVAVLTAGGSGHAQESSNGRSKRA